MEPETNVILDWPRGFDENVGFGVPSMRIYFCFNFVSIGPTIYRHVY